MTADDDLVQLLEGRERGGDHGCRICGKPVAARVFVQLQDRRAGIGDKGKTTSRSVVLCSSHAVSIYNDLTSRIRGGQ